MQQATSCFFRIKKSCVGGLQTEGNMIILTSVDAFASTQRHPQVLMDESFGITCHWGWGAQEMC